MSQQDFQKAIQETIKAYTEQNLHTYKSVRRIGESYLVLA